MIGGGTSNCIVDEMKRGKTFTTNFLTAISSRGDRDILWANSPMVQKSSTVARLSRRTGTLNRLARKVLHRCPEGGEASPAIERTRAWLVAVGMPVAFELSWSIGRARAAKRCFLRQRFGSPRRHRGPCCSMSLKVGGSHGKSADLGFGA
jgi:hypothetical protein